MSWGPLHNADVTERFNKKRYVSTYEVHELKILRFFFCLTKREVPLKTGIQRHCPTVLYDSYATEFYASIKSENLDS